VQIGLYISTAENSSLDVICERFVAAEELGFHTAWAGHTFEWDALSLLALAGRVTEGIELGSWVVPSFPRHPVAMAQQALTVQSACSGRLVLGIGVSHAAVIQKRMGIDYSRPVRHMREYLAVLPSLLAGDSVSHRGEEFYIACCWPHWGRRCSSWRAARQMESRSGSAVRTSSASSRWRASMREPARRAGRGRA